MSAAVPQQPARGVADLVTFAGVAAEGPATPINPGVVVSGRPEERAAVLYTDARGEFSLGIWECSAGAWTVAFEEEEYVRLLEGEIRLTDQAGSSRLFRPGDSFFVPSGFRGTWENVTPVRKIFVCLARKG